MKHMMKQFSIILCCLIPLCIHAQSYRAEAKLDSNHILIGDHLNLHLSYSGSIETAVLFPTICDTCLENIEIIERSDIYIDTIDKNISYQQLITLTSYDSGYYKIPSLAFYSSDSLVLCETSPLYIQVNTLAVDTTKAIKDIKAPLKIPLTLGEIIPYVLLSIALIILIVLVILLIKRIRNNKPILPKWKEKEKTPAHILALNALEALRLKKLWQQGEYKSYYSELSDILRIYIENRWNIQAMEMVSDEIIQALSELSLEDKLIDNIRFTLYHADMVKFAKGQPLSDENQRAFDNVLHFVNATKLVTEQIENKTEK